MTIKRFVCIAAEDSDLNCDMESKKAFATREEAVAQVKQDFLELVKDYQISARVVWDASGNADYDGPKGTFWYSDGCFSYHDRCDCAGCEKILEVTFDLTPEEIEAAKQM